MGLLERGRYNWWIRDRTGRHLDSERSYGVPGESCVLQPSERTRRDSGAGVGGRGGRVDNVAKGNGGPRLLHTPKHVVERVLFRRLIF